MDIQISFDYDKEALSKFPLHELTKYVLEREGCAENTEVSISFVDNDTMTYLNENYRGKKGPTDVLSFECDGADEEGLFDDADDSVFELGDVVIAPDVAYAQTKEFGTTYKEEICLLLVHGLLHLCGYDHIEDADAEVMERREAEIVAAWAGNN